MNMNNNNEYVPCIKAEIAAIVDDGNDDNGIKYLPVVENYEDNYKINNQLMTYDITEINGTLLDRDLKYLFDNSFIDEHEYNVTIHKIYSLNNKLNRPQIRMLFNDGG